MGDPCDCGHPLSRHDRYLRYCTRCGDCTRNQPLRCTCGDDWDWQCKLHGTND